MVNDRVNDKVNDMTAKKLEINQMQILNVLDACYEKALSGTPESKNVYELSEDYLNKYNSIELASEHFVKKQIAKCTTSVFLTSLGGIITLPVALPFNLTTVWYMQLRMIATIAAMAGYNPSDDEVQTLCYICLTGASVAKVFKKSGVKFGEKFAIGMIKKIPGTVLTKISPRKPMILSFWRNMIKGLKYRQNCSLSCSMPFYPLYSW